ncbi:2',3'-cyclic-nucleotide 3'-phosphodiesterase [Astyanax mexicanus]|uniref:2',3'-cyclic-nucleotide 3'-phosphodiesterase n=1 Tax=Astyanax mexicanus TaxID=7994 RepID=A0A8B9LB12_ASTMX|nr:2',3'-cyclic-nucleotide 3'-phosphodiesterase [Astyanax mexicanus]
MEAEQNQEVPEAVAESQAEDKESTSASPPEEEKPQVKISEPEMEATEKVPEVQPAEANSPPDSVKVVESVEAAAEELQAKAPEVEKPAEVVEQKAAEEPEKKPEASESEQKVEAGDAGKAEAAAAPEPTAAKEAESTEKAGGEAPNAEGEKPPAEAEGDKAELPKEAAQQPKEPEIPEFFGWFLLSEVEERIKCSTMDFIKTLDTLEAFKTHLNEFTGEAEKEVDLEQYFQNKGPLHCTTKFCDYGKAEGSKEYAEQQVVKDALGNSAELSVVGLMVTPRTFGAHVALTTEQLQLWPEGADKEGVPEASLPSVEALPVGSRAHVTLGCAANVEAVQTGPDLLDILAQKKGGQEASTVEELELGTLSYLGGGRWYLTLREAVTCDTTFSSFSEDKRPAEPAKKEGGEKKKKPKCSIL